MHSIFQNPSTPVVSLVTGKKGAASERFCLETWIKEDRLVGKEEWQGEGEKAEEHQEQWSLIR